MRMSCCKSLPGATVTTIGENIPEGATGLPAYGPTPLDHVGSRASTLNWYCALLPFGAVSPAKSKKPSTVGFPDPHSVKGFPSASSKPVIGLPALPVNRKPETDEAAYLREGRPVVGSIQRATTLTPCIGCV